MFGFTSLNISLRRLALLSLALFAMSEITHAAPVSGTELIEARGNKHGTLQHHSHCPTVGDMEALIRHRAKGPVKNAVFWSRPANAQQAQTLTQIMQPHGTFIHQYITDADMIHWARVCTAAEREVLWKRASYAFAKACTGKAYAVIVPEAIDPNGVWSKIEFRVLRAARKVDAVYIIHPEYLHNYRNIDAVWTKESTDYEQFPAEP